MYVGSASTLFLLEARVSSRFRHDGKEPSGRLCLRGVKVSSATYVAPEVLVEHVLLPACRLPAGELCGSSVDFATYH